MRDEMPDEILKKLGPLSALAGIWEGDKGEDFAPSEERGTENNKYREHIEFEPIGPVNNHEQELYGLRYKTIACRIGEADAFHEELGYWLWDARDKQVTRCFMVPRGVIVIAGGKVEPAAKTFELSATLGSTTYGICSNPFLDREFRTIAYRLKVKVIDGSTFTYDEDTELQIKGQPNTFHHRDKNTLRRKS